MDFLSAFIAYAISLWFSESDAITAHSNYCQNLYWQPNALEKMEKYDCDVQSIASEIERVNSGRY